MPVSMNNTQVVFNDATTQTTAPVNTNANVNSVSAGSGISVSATTGALTVTNAGVTSVTGAGTVSVSASTGGVTITGTGGSGTVTSVATGNGLSGGTISSTGTLVIACPSFNSVGSYCYVNNDGSTVSSGFNSGSNYSAGGGNSQIQSVFLHDNGSGWFAVRLNNLSGTWKWMAGPVASLAYFTPIGMACRVS